MAAKINPELLEQMSQSGSDPVQAIVQLRYADRPEIVPTSEEATQLAEHVLQRVEKVVGHSPMRTNLLRNLASVVIEADSPFLRLLIEQPEVVSALPNRTSQSMFIPPKGKRPA